MAYTSKELEIIGLEERRVEKQRQEEALKELEGVFHLDPGKVPPFPAEVLPKALKDYIINHSTGMKAPADFLALPMLTVLATAIGNKVFIRSNETWVEPSRIWTIFVSDPSTKKTPLYKAAIVPIRHIQRKWNDEFIEKEKEYKHDLEIYQHEIRSKGNTSPKKPIEPIKKTIYKTESTTEGIIKTLSKNPQGIAYLNDEVSAWIHGLNQYKGKGGNDRQFWLQVWSLEDIELGRANLDLSIPSPLVNLAGGIQPSVLPDLIADNGKQDGLVQRFLFAYPEPAGKQYFNRHAKIDPNAVKGYQEIIERLLEYRMLDEKKYLTITEKGLDYFELYHNQLEDEKEHLPENLISSWEKLKGFLMILSLVIHLTRYAANEVDQDDQVDDESMLRAIALMEYFKTHLKKVFNILSANEQEKKMLAVVETIRRHFKKEETTSMTLKELLRKNPASIKTKHDLLPILEMAERYRLVRLIKRETHNKLTSYEIQLIENDE